MSEFLRTLLLINGYVACALFVFCLLIAPPARADNDAFSNAVAYVAVTIATAMDTGGDDDD